MSALPFDSLPPFKRRSMRLEVAGRDVTGHGSSGKSFTKLLHYRGSCLSSTVGEGWGEEALSVEFLRSDYWRALIA